MAIIFISQPSAAADSEKTAGIIGKIQKSFDDTLGMTARFTQEFESKGFGKTSVHKGKMSMLKPARMLWKYDSPKGRILVADGEKLWFYDPEENVAYYEKIEGFLSEKSPALFLAGKQTMRELFETSVAPQGKMDKMNDVVRLKLVPKTPQPGVKAMLLTVDATSFDIVELLMVDYVGNKNRITFSKEDRSASPDPSIFTFTPPEGAPVKAMNKVPGAE
ncbi:MAG: outer membrane lipoprotein carrier protein LolA [Nitrospinae bacterium]|nr:outer membrane lipoprotein carrier protein LolA [Nitrospinota bacterium]